MDLSLGLHLLLFAVVLMMCCLLDHEQYQFSSFVIVITKTRVVAAMIAVTYMMPTDPFCRLMVLISSLSSPTTDKWKNSLVHTIKYNYVFFMYMLWLISSYPRSAIVIILKLLSYRYFISTSNRFTAVSIGLLLSRKSG
jgi:hypothetical protein